MLTIITPSCRQHLLFELRDSIDFKKIHKWIIVYDTSKNRNYSKLFNHEQIIECFCNVEGEAGHPQRNFGLSLVSSGMVYFLDDDNIIHPEFWNLEFSEDYFYTFDQKRKDKILKGDNIQVGEIDTAMFVVPKSMCFDWDITKYYADGLFISSVYNKNIDKHKYIAKIACFYNYLTR